MTAIRLQGLNKVFADGTRAVDDLNLDIPSGEFVTFLGPSGCGKTTTLRMIAGLESPSGGTIEFGGRVINELAPGERNLAMVFQSYALYPHMTVRENLEYPLKKRGVAKAERAVQVNALAATLQLDALLDRKPRQLSGGQQQRVALGRAMIRAPEAFLFDEPLSNLDATLRAAMRAELIQLHQRLGKTMIYVTHDQVEAMTMSTRIAVMYRGRLQQIDTPGTVYSAPANRFVASFVGTPAMNFIPGELDGVAVRVAFGTVALPLETARRLDGHKAGRRVVLGARPEDVLPGEGPYQGSVTVVEPMGHESIVFLDLGGQPLIARIGPDAPFQPRMPLNAALRTSKLHLFDADTGDRI